MCSNRGGGGGGGGGGGANKKVEDTIVKGLVPDPFLFTETTRTSLIQPIASPPAQSRSL